MRIAEVHTDNTVHAIIDTDEHPKYDSKVLLGLKPSTPLLGYFEAGPEVQERWIRSEDGSYSTPPEPEPAEEL